MPLIVLCDLQLPCHCSKHHEKQHHMLQLQPVCSSHLTTTLLFKIKSYPPINNPQATLFIAGKECCSKIWIFPKETQASCLLSQSLRGDLQTFTLCSPSFSQVHSDSNLTHSSIPSDNLSCRMSFGNMEIKIYVAIVYTCIRSHCFPSKLALAVL